MMTSKKTRFGSPGPVVRTLLGLVLVACLVAMGSPAFATDTDCDGSESDSAGYSCQTETNDPDYVPDISTTGTAITTWYPKGCSGDDCYALVDMTDGKSFTWYGNTYTSVYVGSNGYVSFGSGYTQEVSTLSIPSTSNPNNVVYAYGDDLDPSNNGTVYYQQTICTADLDEDGTNDDCLVVQWDGVPYYGSSNTVTVQLALDFAVQTALVEIEAENDTTGEKPQLVGTENAYGTVGLWYKNGGDVDSRAASAGQSFGFEPDQESPSVTSTTPADDATGVSLSQDVVINFDEAMDTSSVSLAVVSGTDPGSWSPSWSNGNRTVTYTHADFSDDETYVLQVTGTDAAGNSLENVNNSSATCTTGYCWNFDTVDQTAPANVSLVTSTSGDLRVTLQWSNPTDSDFDGVLVLQKQGSAVDAAPTDGQSYSVGDTIGTGNTVVCVTSAADTSCVDNTVSNGNTYYYKAFAFDTSKNYASGVTSKGMPRATSTYKWAYTTTASTLAPVGAVPGQYLVATGNDQRLHRMNELDGLRTGWTPILLGGAVQSRPMVGDLTGSNDYTAFFTAQNGYLYRYALDDGTSSAEGSTDVVGDASCNSGILQAGPVVMLDRFDGNSNSDDNAVIVATRCGTTDNKVLLYSLDLNTLYDTYDGGSDGLGISNATPRILYLDDRSNKVYVPVRDDDTSQTSLVVLSVDSGPAFSLYAEITGKGGVDATPIVFRHGSDYLLVFGNTSGVIYSYNALVLDGSSLRLMDTYDGGDGAVKGIAVSTQIKDPATSTYYHWVVWSTDTKVHGIKLLGNATFDTSSYWEKTVTSPSVPIVLRWVGGTENTYAYVGDGNGYLYELDVTDSGSTHRSWLVESGTTVGDPTFDYNDGSNQGIVVGTTGGSIHWVTLD